MIYINDLPDRIFNVFKMSAYDSKIIAELNEGSDSSLQEDINEIKGGILYNLQIHGRRRVRYKEF